MTGITSSPSASIMAGIVTSGATAGLASVAGLAQPAETGPATSGYSDAPADTPNPLVMHPAGRFQRFAHSVAAFAPVIGIGTALATALYFRDWYGLGLLAIAVPGPGLVATDGEKTPAGAPETEGPPQLPPPAQEMSATGGGAATETIEPTQLLDRANQFLRLPGRHDGEVVFVDPELREISRKVQAFLRRSGESAQIVLRRYPEGADHPNADSFFGKNQAQFLAGKLLETKGHNNLEVLIVDTEGLINAGIIAFFRAYNLDVVITKLSEPLAKPTPQPSFLRFPEPFVRFPESIGELPIHGRMRRTLEQYGIQTFPTTREFCTKEYYITKNIWVILNKALRPFGLRLGMTEAEFAAAEAAYAQNPLIVPLPQRISDLPLQDAALKALGKLRIGSLRDLCLRSAQSIFKTNKLGRIALDTITSALRAYGLRLGMTAAEFDAVAAARASQQK